MLDKMLSIFGLGAARSAERRGADRRTDGSRAIIEYLGEDHVGRILDVSRTGIRFTCTEEIGPTHTVIARIDIGNDRCTHIPLRVVWLRKGPWTNEYGAACDPSVHAVARLLLRKYASRLVRKPLNSAA